MLTDTHAHLYWDSFKDDFDEMIQRAFDAGVTTLINVGVDVEKSKVAAEQTQKTNWPKKLSVYSTIGIHPHEAVKYYINPDVSIHKDIRRLKQMYKSGSEKVVAVGECGLDFLFESNPDWIPHSLRHSELDSESQNKIPKQVRDDELIAQVKELQKKLFQAQVDLAKELKLPLIIHCRDDRSENPGNNEAWTEVLKMVGNHPTILHCYSGLPSTTNQVLKTQNLIVSFAGTITYPRNNYLREAVKIIPLDRIVLETDCPFLPPQSKRGMRNEPANVVEIAQTVADINGLSLKEVARQTRENTTKILRLRSG